ncbi:MAG: monovalent cation/H+ antiporter complex subunit F [Candidatus Hadarchaeales archaeon]
MIEVMVVIIVACTLAFLRAAAGPTAPDRVVAIDAITSLLIAALVILGVYYNALIYLDVALVYAVLAFLGTVAIAKYLEGKKVEE